MSIIQSLEKVRKKLNVSEKEKSPIPSENNIDFNNNNAADKKNLFKNSWTPTLAEKISIILLNS